MNAPLRLADVIAGVAAAFGVTPAARSRTRTVSAARGAACWWARRVTPASYPEIAAALGLANHTSALHASRAWESRRRHAPWTALHTTLAQQFRRTAS